MNGNCKTCSVEDSCAYKYKPCDCRDYMKFVPSDAYTVGVFSNAMAHKMKLAASKGRSGWQELPVQDLQKMLVEHIEKGDPIDVALFAMMLWMRGFRTTLRVDQIHTDYKHELGNLLCRIHRDGGHYIQEHGWRKAIDDADAICARQNALRDIQSYAGVKVWKGDLQSFQQVSEQSIDCEVAKGQALRNAAEKCITDLSKG